MDKTREGVKRLLVYYNYEQGIEEERLNKTGDFTKSNELDDSFVLKICHLFPKTKENPDGYEPKPDELETCRHLDPLCYQGLRSNLKCHSKRIDCQFYEPSLSLKPEIPHFASEDEERAFWATHDSINYADTATPVVLEYKPKPDDRLLDENKEYYQVLYNKEEIMDNTCPECEGEKKIPAVKALHRGVTTVLLYKDCPICQGTGVKPCHHLVAEATGICLHCGVKVSSTKPDRLLGDEAIAGALNKEGYSADRSGRSFYDIDISPKDRAIAKAQDAETASILKAELRKQAKEGG